MSQAVEGQETRFLVDTQQPYAQVLLEYRPSGLVVASYVYGHGLISQARDGARVFADQVRFDLFDRGDAGQGAAFGDRARPSR
ncbi:MAG: hypothetical protein HC869_18515 [Rhodospirillales bacterium]|nr:hypothetical protein [Rhodospirillales bacterium]